MQQLHHYIDGCFVPTTGGMIDNIMPATGQAYMQVPVGNAEDVEQAVQAARQAFVPWRDAPAEQRANYLWRIADAIESQASELAEIESTDTGKPLLAAQQMDIPRAASNFRFFAQAATQFASESHATNNALHYTLRQPLGIVGCISPWNLPLYLLTWKIAPALAAGNCVIAKPSELTPATAHRLAELCQQVELPPGVLNILHGRGDTVGQALLEHSSVQAISFTGGTQTGSHIAKTVAPYFKKLSLEMGGKNPALVFSDCDFDRTIREVVRSSFTNQGQVCLCTSRILVEQSLYSRFVDAFVKQVSTLVVGDPLEAATQQGAVISAQQQQKILAAMMQAKMAGGEIQIGGDAAVIKGRCQNGYFVQPTVITNTRYQDEINRREIFGPCVTIQAFASDDEALFLANASSYGLCASVWSQNIQRCHFLAEKLECGMVWLNSWLLRDLRTPFGGTKQSGLGREGGVEALRFFTETKNVCVSLQ